MLTGAWLSIIPFCGLLPLSPIFPSCSCSCSPHNPHTSLLLPPLSSLLHVCHLLLWSPKTHSRLQPNSAASRYSHSLDLLLFVLLLFPDLAFIHNSSILDLLPGKGSHTRECNQAPASLPILTRVLSGSSSTAALSGYPLPPCSPSPLPPLLHPSAIFSKFSIPNQKRKKEKHTHTHTHTHNQVCFAFKTV